MAAFVHHRTIEFHETDAAGLVHFSNYFRYAESAEHALYREIGYPMMNQDGTTFLGWPRVRAQAKYSAPLASGDIARIEIWIEEVKDKAIEWAFKLFRDSDRVLAAKGSFTTLHTRIDVLTREMKVVSIPEVLVDKLKPFTLDA